MNNFVIEQYLIRAISKEKNRYYILKKYSETGVTIRCSDGKKSQMINIYELENDDVGKVVYKYYNLIHDCNLKYAEKALANTILRIRNLNIKEYGDCMQCECLAKDKENIKVTKFYYKAKGRMFYRAFGHKWQIKQ